MKRPHASALGVVAAILVLQALPVFAQTLDDSFRADVKKLLEVTNTTQIATQVASLTSAQVLEGFKQAQPGIPDRAITLAKELLDEEFAQAFRGPDGLVEQMIPLYAKHFTQEEVRGLTAFYSSDLGRKAIAELPTLVQESAGVAQHWIAKQMPAITAKMRDRLRAEGLIK